MRKRTAILASVVMASNMYAITASDIIGNITNLINGQGINLSSIVNTVFGSSSIGNYIGELYAVSNAKLYCADTNTLPNTGSICSVANTGANLNQSILDTPFCSISLGLPQSANPFSKLSNMCQSTTSSLTYNIYDFMNSPKNIIEASNPKYTYYKSSNICGYQQSSAQQSGANVEDEFMTIVDEEASSIDYFDTAGESRYDCVELAVKNGVDPEDYCKTERFFSAGNKTETEARKDIDKIAKENLKEESFSNVDTSVENEKKIKSDLLQQCSNNDSLSAARDCEDQYYENTYKIKKKKDVANKEVEIAQSQLSTVAEKASAGDYTIVLPTNEMKERIPAGLRKNFVFLSDRLFANRVLIEYYETEIVNLKKELADLLYEKRISCTRQFYPKPYKKALKDVMENVDAE